jgi:hypothetical protein
MARRKMIHSMVIPTFSAYQDVITIYTTDKDSANRTLRLNLDITEAEKMAGELNRAIVKAKEFGAVKETPEYLQFLALREKFGAIAR